MLLGTRDQGFWTNLLLYWRAFAQRARYILRSQSRLRIWLRDGLGRRLVLRCNPVGELDREGDRGDRKEVLHLLGVLGVRRSRSWVYERKLPMKREREKLREWGVRNT